jgi:hypothetical protein
MSKSLEERMAFLNDEMSHFATRTVLLEFIIRALIERSKLSQSEVLAIMQPYRSKATAKQERLLEEGIRQFFIPLDGTQIPQ